MKSMLKSIYLLSILCYLLFVSCDNVFELPKDAPDALPAGYGRVAVTLTGAARTVFPAMPVFEKIEYKFAKVTNGTPGTPAAKVPVNGLFELEFGSWQVTVTAYAEATDTVPAGTGTSDTFSVSATATADVSVQLAGNVATGEGTFSYHVEYPDGAVITVFSLENLLDDDAAPIDLTPATTSVSPYSGTEENIPAGIYWLTVQLIKDGVTTGANEAVYIYNGLDSVYGTADVPIIFSEDNFLAITYVITGSGTAFTATKDGVTVGTAGQPIQDVIDAIEIDNIQTNGGRDYTVQFGDGEEVLDIGTASASLNSYWVIITLTGKITSANTTQNGTVRINTNVSINSVADIANTGGTSGRAIYNGSSRPVTISGGTVEADSGYAINNSAGSDITISGGEVSTTSGRAIYNASSGTVNISGGTVSATSGVAVYNDGAITVSGDAVVTSENTSASSGTINNNSNGSIAITGGTVKNTSTSTGNVVYNRINGMVTISGGTVDAGEANGTRKAVYNTATDGIITLGGDPAITGVIFQNSTAALRLSSFSPVTGKEYRLVYAAYTAGNIAVRGGAGFLNNFKLLSTFDYILAARGGSLVIIDVNSQNLIPDGTQYIISGVGTSFRGYRNDTDTTVDGAVDQPLQTVIDAIRTEALGASIGIQFALGGNAVLNIGVASVSFNNTDGTWGPITLTGSITSTHAISNEGAVMISGGVSVTSTADITITSDNTNYSAIRNDNTAATGGTVTISGGTVKATGNSRAVYNASANTVTLGGNPEIIGLIYQNTVAALSLSNFNPATGRVYTLGSDSAAFFNNDGTTVAVTGGANFIANFALDSSNSSLTAWKLAVSGDDLVIAANP